MLVLSCPAILVPCALAAFRRLPLSVWSSRVNLHLPTGRSEGSQGAVGSKEGACEGFRISTQPWVEDGLKKGWVTLVVVVVAMVVLVMMMHVRRLRLAGWRLAAGGRRQTARQTSGLDAQSEN